MASGFKPDFSKDNDYTSEYNFNRVIWGANAPITEKDINEAQVIQGNKIKTVVSTVLGDGIIQGELLYKPGEEIIQEEVITDEVWYNRYLSDSDGARVTKIGMSSSGAYGIVGMVDSSVVTDCMVYCYDDFKRKRGIIIDSEMYEASNYYLDKIGFDSVYYFVKTAGFGGTNLSFETRVAPYFCTNLGDYGEGNYLHFEKMNKRFPNLDDYPNVKAYYITHQYYYYNIPHTVVLDGDNKYYSRVERLDIDNNYHLICGNVYKYYSLIDKKELSITIDETHKQAVDDGSVVCLCSKDSDLISIEDVYGARGTGLYICKHEPNPQDISTYVYVSYFEHSDDAFLKPTGNVYKTEIREHTVVDNTKIIFYMDNAKISLSGHIIDIGHIEKEFLLPEDKSNVDVYFNLWNEIITAGDEIHKNGNLQGEMLNNYLVDSRYGVEITRREQLMYQLCIESELVTDKKSVNMVVASARRDDSNGQIVEVKINEASNTLKLNDNKMQVINSAIQTPFGIETFHCGYGQAIGGYWHVCDMIMQGDYPDMPIVFSCVQRDALPYQLVLLFKSVRFADGFVPKYFRHISIDGNFDNTINAVIAKVADNKFSLYIKKNAPYDELGIVDMKRTYIHNLVDIKWVGEFVDDYPKDATSQGSWTFSCGNAGYGYNDDTDYLAILVPPHAGDGFHYIKVPYHGILPNIEKSINDGGHGNLGTLAWAFAMAYIKTICCDLLIPSSDGQGDIGADDKKIGTIYVHVLTGGTILPVQNGTAYVKSLDAYGYGSIGGLNNAYNEASIHRILSNMIGDPTKYVKDIYVNNIHTKSDMFVPSKYSGARKTVFDLTVYFDGTIHNTYSFESDGANKESAFFCYSNNLAVRHSLGTAAQGWDNIYSKNNLIVTSDRRKKKNIFYFGSNENYSVNFWSDELLINFYMGLEAVIYTYKDGERPHHGLISQDFEELMRKLNIQDHAAFIKSPIYAKIKIFVVDGGTYNVTEKNDENTIIDYNYSIRYAELEADTIRFNQLLYKKYEQQQEEINALKQENQEIKQQLAILMEKVNSLME